jgi:pyrimidine nucleoside transport protein
MTILVLRWKYGYIAIKFLSDEIIKFIEYGFEGAATVFGDPFLVFHPFAFMVSIHLLTYQECI